MYPSKELPRHPNAAAEPGLEEHLRGLILNNAAAQEPRLPPHMAGASLADQHAYLATAISQNQAHGISGAPELQHGKKRPNQAQRRQMSSQLSIPVEPSKGPVQSNNHAFPPNSYPRPSSQYNSNPHFPPSNQYNPAPRFNDNSQVYASSSYQNPQTQNQSHFQNSGNRSSYSPRGQHVQGPPLANQQARGSSYHPQNRQFQPHYQQQFSHPAPTSQYARPQTQNRQLYQPNDQGGTNRGRPSNINSEGITSQSVHLEGLLQTVVYTVGIDVKELTEKETFRSVVEQACKDAICQYEHKELSNQVFDISSVELRCFGSMSSGFATKASDMDLALVTPQSKPAADSPESLIPRILERKLLDMGYGARLLTRTRVPIIKLCEKPPPKLLADLLQERTRWETGLQEEENSTIVKSTASKDAMTKIVDGAKKPAISGPESTSAEPATKEGSLESKLSKLKQKENQSLGDYYNTAKRFLRQLGSHDISLTSPDLSDLEGSALNAVCKAFISGLKFEDLVTRLQTYQSIRPLFDTSDSFLQRSLNGVWNQVEGERLAMAWEARPLPESNEQREMECMRAVEAWRLLQDKCFGDPVPYNRLVYMAAEKLKTFGSLQLMFLEQIHQEDPVFYYKRSTKIMNDLRGGGAHQEQDIISPIMVTHYIEGVTNTEIQEALRTLNSSQMTLDGISFKHRILQLATDYQTSLGKGLFDEDDKADVEQYISLLRSPTLNTSANPEQMSLVAKIRTLPDPIITSKPKDRYKDHLEFPKTDIGIQCDINFSAHLALHNTLLLRCYSHSDPRVKPMILFIKNWAKVRGINTPYRGTLSSYGYVLMVLHYLVNIAQPFVCPNLQMVQKDPPPTLPPAEVEAQTVCQGRDVRFWRNESAISDLADRGHLNHNKDSIGFLLRGFFEYFAQNGHMTTVQSRGFDWGRDVLSLRTQHGRLSKQEKGWVGAKTVYETTAIAAPPMNSASASTQDQTKEDNSPVLDREEVKPAKQKTVEEVKEIRHRYLFAIEDPFELDHNVARTVTHDGIVQIRDEFRRAWRIILGIGRGNQEGLLDPLLSPNAPESGLQELLNLIHGPVAVQVD